jgi:hypothetical protein
MADFGSIESLLVDHWTQQKEKALTAFMERRQNYVQSKPVLCASGQIAGQERAEMGNSGDLPGGTAWPPVSRYYEITPA